MFFTEITILQYIENLGGAMKKQKISGKSVALYQLEDEHIKPYLKLFSPTVQELLHVKDSASEERYLRGTLQENNVHFYVVSDSSTDLIIGSIEIRKPGYRSQLYCWLHEQFWGTGKFYEAMQLASQDYFQKTDERSIAARVDIDNKRSYYALKKVGFIEAGKAAGPHGLQYEMVLIKK